MAKDKLTITKEMKKWMRTIDRMKKKQAEEVAAIPRSKKMWFFNKRASNKFERIVRFRMPYDKRSNIPGKNYGISSMQFRFILKGRKGAVQILMGTQYYLPATVNEYFESKSMSNILKTYDGKDQKPFECWDVGYHSISKPSYLEKDDKRPCDINDCGHCYYDGSSLRGRDDKLEELFMEKGEDAMWEYLEKIYDETFKDKKPSGFGLMIKALGHVLSKKEKENET